MKRINREESVFYMSRHNKPAETANSGETVIFETSDCYNNQIKSEDQQFDSINREFNNPATGPLYINDAAPGDILKVEILDIKIGSTGVMTVRPGSGVLGDFIEDFRSKIIPINGDRAIFNDKVTIPLSPMIGVIGVAPKETEPKTTVPEEHGGNLDCKKITKGSTVYLPVFVNGALLSIGDLHAVMGDGEIVICGLEVQGEVTVRVSAIKNKKLPLPMVIDSQHIMTLSSKPTLDEASCQATINMHDFLVKELGMSVHEAGMLLSLVGDLRICQVVDPLMTARMELPLWILDNYKYKLV